MAGCGNRLKRHSYRRRDDCCNFVYVRGIRNTAQTPLLLLDGLDINEKLVIQRWSTPDDVECARRRDSMDKAVEAVHGGGDREGRNPATIS